MSDAVIALHRRQFLLAPRRSTPPAVPDGWVRHAIGERVLHAHPELRVTTVRDRGGGGWLLLGRAVSLGVDRTPEEALGHVGTEDVPDATRSLTGRWLLVGEDVIVPDASSQLGCLFGQDEEGRCWASSSAALLITALPRLSCIRDPRTVRFDSGISWYPPPRTRFVGIDRLLPSQVLNLSGNEAVHRRLLGKAGPYRDEKAIPKEVAALMRVGLERLHQQGEHEILIGLTGGADSRAVLATAHAAGVPVRTYTRLHPRQKVADRVLPSRLAAIADRPHHMTRRRRTREDRSQILQSHTGGIVSAGDARAFLYGERDEVHGIVVSGRAFEVASGHADWSSLPEDFVDAEAATEAFLRHMGESMGSPAAMAVRSYFDWVAANPEPSVDWRDRLYWETRLCGWAAAKEQASDLLPAERWPLMNSSAMFAAMLAMPTARRRAGAIQEGIIAETMPDLLSLPINPPDRTYVTSRPWSVARRWGHRGARRVVNRLRLERDRALRWQRAPLQDEN